MENTKLATEFVASTNAKDYELKTYNYKGLVKLLSQKECESKNKNGSYKFIACVFLIHIENSDQPLYFNYNKQGTQRFVADDKKLPHLLFTIDFDWYIRKEAFEKEVNGIKEKSIIEKYKIKQINSLIDYDTHEVISIN